MTSPEHLVPLQRTEEALGTPLLYSRKAVDADKAEGWRVLGAWSAHFAQIVEASSANRLFEESVAYLKDTGFMQSKDNYRAYFSFDNPSRPHAATFSPEAFERVVDAAALILTRRIASVRDGKRNSLFKDQVYLNKLNAYIQARAATDQRKNGNQTL